jgi:pimeloyl-ACP methyl ester carboxylesterase
MGAAMSWRTSYPFESHYWDSPYGKIHYLDEGPRVLPNGESAPVVVMVHGNPTWSFFYRNVVMRLRDRCRCIVPDHLGCGLSDKPQDAPYTLATHIQNLQGLLRNLQISKAGLIVHDWGGPIGTGSFLLDETATSLRGMGGLQLENLAVLNTSPGYSADVPWRILLCRTKYVGEWLVRGCNGFAGPASWMSVVRPLSKPVKDGFLYPYRNWNDRVAVYRFVRDIPRQPSDPAWAVLHEIGERIPLLNGKIPANLYWGMKDFCFHEGYLRYWQEKLPAATSHTYADAGHYLLEDRGEKILPLLEQQFCGSND